MVGRGLRGRDKIDCFTLVAEVSVDGTTREIPLCGYQLTDLKRVREATEKLQDQLRTPEEKVAGDKAMAEILFFLNLGLNLLLIP